MKRLFIIVSLLLVFSFLLISCSSKAEESLAEESTENEDVTQDALNSSPVADAGEDIRCTAGTEITLNGSDSSDLDGDQLSYTWAIDGEEYSGKILTFEVGDPGTYYFTLTVSDGKSSDNDMVQVTVVDKIEVTKEETQEEMMQEGTEEETVEEVVVEDETKEEIVGEMSSPREWQAKCVGVIDGDTIDLEDGTRVRLIGIDSPEYNQEYGTECLQACSSLVLNKTVTLVKDVSEMDQYGRTLAYVYVGDLFVNAHLVRQGFATAFRYPPDTKYSDYFDDLESQAKAEGLGLWGLVAEEEPSSEQSSGIQFCGSKKSEVYHHMWCSSVDDIKPSNYVEYADSADARAHGKRPCKRCNPP